MSTDMTYCVTEDCPMSGKCKRAEPAPEYASRRFYHWAFAQPDRGAVSDPMIHCDGYLEPRPAAEGGERE